MIGLRSSGAAGGLLVACGLFGWCRRRRAAGARASCRRRGDGAAGLLVVARRRRPSWACRGSRGARLDAVAAFPHSCRTTGRGRRAFVVPLPPAAAGRRAEPPALAVGSACFQQHRGLLERTAGRQQRADRPGTADHASGLRHPAPAGGSPPGAGPWKSPCAFVPCPVMPIWANARCGPGSTAALARPAAGAEQPGRAVRRRPLAPAGALGRGSGDLPGELLLHACWRGRGGPAGNA